jgi:tetratricopeptide (TPR) repeat protein
VLREWLERPLDAPVFIVLSYRSEETSTSASLSLLLDHPEATVQEAQVAIDLEPLQASDVRTLCMNRLAQRSAAPQAMIERIVLESHGNPFLAQQLTAIAEAKLARGDTSLDGLSMEALVERASAFLGESARALLNVLALAGRPLPSQLALSIAGVFSGGRAHIHTLRVLRLVRTRDVSGMRLLEVYHDRVRETVTSTVSAAESERIHAELLRALEAQERPDHDWLHMLALGAGQRGAAFRHGLSAAERAAESLAFERAAELYSKCLVLFDGELELHALYTKLAAAQARCRRGYEAAKAYLSAAEHAPAGKSAQLLQLAASHLIRSGRFEEGERIVQQVLETQGLHVPATPAGQLAALVWETGRISLRSLDVPLGRKNTAPSEVVGNALLYGTLAIETQQYAPLRSGLFTARALRLSLDYGDNNQVARALCMAAVIACVSGTQRAARRANDLLERAEQLFKRDSDEDVRLELLCAQAVCAQFRGDLAAALEPSQAVERLTDAKSAGSGGLHGDYYYMFMVQMVRISALQGLGRLTEARQVIREHVARARATDNLSAILQVSMNRAVDEQAFEMCVGSRARLDAEYEQLPRGDFGILHVAHLLAVMRAACSTREYAWAFERLGEFWETYQRSLVHRSAFMACLAHTTHARLLLNHHVETGANGDVAALVKNDLKQLERLPPALFRDVAIARTRARVAFLKGDRERAIELLRPSLERFEKTAMLQEIDHDRYTLGLLIGGAEGQQLIAAARKTLADCGICDPDANMRAYIPELMPKQS